jgi:two-component system response regulator AlgR
MSAQYLVVDDEHLARARLKELIRRIKPKSKILEAQNGEEAIDLFEIHRPKLALVDIRMPGIGGIELAYHLSALEHPPAVIFTTAHNEYALQAFDANAIDYLLKPIHLERLQRALQKAEPLTEEQNQVLKEGNDDRTHISVNQRGRLKLIPIKDIAYFKAENKYVVIKTHEGEFLLNDTLNQLEGELGDGYIRAHRNTLLSTQYIEGMEKIDDDRWQVTLQGFDDKIEVSRRQRPIIRSWLKGAN